MNTPHTFNLGPTVLQRGLTIPSLQLVYQTYGTLAPDKRNAVLYPTSYGSQHTDIEWLIGPGRILDSNKYFIIITNKFGNGLSTSPSNLAAPHTHGRFPVFTHWDNVHAQKRLIEEVFGIDKLALVYGWSMGGQQALHWGAIFPDKVEKIVAICTSARTSPHNKVFIEGVRSALIADPAWANGTFSSYPVRGLQAFARCYAGWALSQAFYREELWRTLGFSSVEDFLIRNWEANFMRRNPNDLLAMLETWTQSDISDNPIYKGDLKAALGAIKAKSIIMPSTTDLYFTAEDGEIETRQMPNAEFRPIKSVWGHRAGNPLGNPADEAFIRAAVAELMAN
jgi:homoserine O-acetyltransferase/O-succinyltransferase